MNTPIYSVHSDAKYNIFLVLGLKTANVVFLLVRKISLYTLFRPYALKGAS